MNCSEHLLVHLPRIVSICAAASPATGHWGMCPLEFAYIQIFGKEFVQSFTFWWLYHHEPVHLAPVPRRATFWRRHSVIYWTWRLLVSMYPFQLPTWLFRPSFLLPPGLLRWPATCSRKVLVMCRISTTSTIFLPWMNGSLKTEPVTLHHHLPHDRKLGTNLWWMSPPRMCCLPNKPGRVVPAYLRSQHYMPEHILMQFLALQSVSGWTMHLCTLPLSFV